MDPVLQSFSSTSEKTLAKLPQLKISGRKKIRRKKTMKLVRKVLFFLEFVQKFLDFARENFGQVAKTGLYLYNETLLDMKHCKN